MASTFATFKEINRLLHRFCVFSKYSIVYKRYSCIVGKHPPWSPPFQEVPIAAQHGSGQPHLRQDSHTCGLAKRLATPGFKMLLWMLVLNMPRWRHTYLSWCFRLCWFEIQTRTYLNCWFGFYGFGPLPGKIWIVNSAMFEFMMFTFCQEDPKPQKTKKTTH